MKKSASGFTLIEMIIIILIIAVLSVEILTQSSNTVNPLTVAAAASQVANDIRYTQALAMYTGQRYYLVALSVTQYSIENSIGTAIVLANGTTVTNLSSVFISATSNIANLIGFTSRGVPIVDTAGDLLTAAATMTLTAGAYSSTITISPTTGRVTIS